MSKQIITREKMNKMYNAVSLSISIIYKWRRKLDMKMLEREFDAIPRASYESVVSLVMDAVQQLKEARNDLGRLSFAEETTLEKEKEKCDWKECEKYKIVDRSIAHWCRKHRNLIEEDE